ncbi:MAG: hypothetical protein U0T69_11040 [Chitinophagales bacterium]
MNETFLRKIFSLLSGNQQFPYYQAERRIDIFINFFLKDIIQQHTEFEDAIFVAAEFPLKKNEKTDHAAHIDYLMYSKSKSTVLLVELKTDDSSFDPEQIDFYLNYENFKDWYDKFESIKLNRHKSLKIKLQDTIREKIGTDLQCIKTNVVVLKPTFQVADYDKLKGDHKRVAFIPLINLNITTEFQKEWDLMKEAVLADLRQRKRPADLKK